MITRRIIHIINIILQQTEAKSADPLKSDEDSDEDDELLQSCIQLGMPENTPNKIGSNPEVFVKPVYSSHSEKVSYYY